MNEPKTYIGDPMIAGTTHANPKYILWQQQELEKKQIRSDELEEVLRLVYNEFLFKPETPVDVVQRIENLLDI